MLIRWIEESFGRHGCDKRVTGKAYLIKTNPDKNECDYMYSEIDNCLWILTSLDTNMFCLMEQLFKAQELPLKTFKRYLNGGDNHYISYELAELCTLNSNTLSDAMVKYIPEKAMKHAKHILDNLEVYKYQAVSF